MKVQIFIPCFVDQLYPQTAINMVRVLEKAGCEVSYNPNQTCCGQPAFNAGFWDDARDVCSKFLKDFSSNEIIVAPVPVVWVLSVIITHACLKILPLHNEVKAIGKIFMSFPISW